MKFALAGGGTGGHAYPSIAVGERLRAEGDADLVYYGTAHGPERRMAQAAGIEYHAVPASQVRGNPWRMTTGSLNLLRGARAVRTSFARERPGALFATGGYGAAPVGWAASKARVPMLLFLPDVHPGWAVRFLQRYAATIACTVEASLERLPSGKAVVTGYPVRTQFCEATREGGIERFGLDPRLPTLLVTGGSLGAHQINLVVASALRRLLERAQLIHVAGAEEEAWLARERDKLPDWQRERYHLYAYTDEMAWAMAASDLAVTRAGASVLGELPMVGLPAIVIPGDFSDQRINAAYLADHGAAIALGSENVGDLDHVALRLLDDPPARAEMSRAMRTLAKPDAAARLASMLRELAA